MNMKPTQADMLSLDGLSKLETMFTGGARAADSYSGPTRSEKDCPMMLCCRRLQLANGLKHSTQGGGGWSLYGNGGQVRFMFFVVLTWTRTGFRHVEEMGRSTRASRESRWNHLIEPRHPWPMMRCPLYRAGYLARSCAKTHCRACHGCYRPYLQHARIPISFQGGLQALYLHHTCTSRGSRGPCLVRAKCTAPKR